MLQPGDQAPDFELLDQNENQVKLTDFGGRKVLVYFYPNGGHNHPTSTQARWPVAGGARASRSPDSRATH